MTNNTEYKSPQIGLGEPVQEEVQKLESFWEKFKRFAKTKKFKLIVALGILAIAAIIALAVVLQTPPKPKPPILTPTPTPITFQTPTPTAALPPLSSEAANLSEELKKQIYQDPNLTFPKLDWKITLKE